jgi:hypothetical protein
VDRRRGGHGEARCAGILERPEEVQGVEGECGEAPVGRPRVAWACGLVGISERGSLARRLAEIGPQAQVPIQALGLAWSIEAGTAASVAASEGSAFARPGPVWHNKNKQASLIPEGWPGVDTQADWIQSTYHGWV